MNVTPDPADMARSFEEVRQKIAHTDADVRAVVVGMPAAGIEEVARARFSAIGVTLTDEQITEYSRSVERDEPFEFALE